MQPMRLRRSHAFLISNYLSHSRNGTCSVHPVISVVLQSPNVEESAKDVRVKGEQVETQNSTRFEKQTNNQVFSPISTKKLVHPQKVL